MNILRQTVAAALAAAILFSDPASARSDYDVRIEGAPDGLEDKLEIISEVKKGVRDYPTRAALRRAAERDAALFENALTASGYYDSSIEVDVAQEAPDGPMSAIFTITPGPVFTITQYDIIYQDDYDDRPDRMEDAGLSPKGAADGAALQTRQVEFLAYLLNNGYPEAHIVNRRAIANFETGEASAVFVFTSGPKARFGDIRIIGAQKTNPSYLQRLQSWEDGEIFDRSKLLTYRDRLSATALFSSIEVSSSVSEETGAAPVNVNVVESKRRSIGVGASFSTDEGPGGILFFENRNIFGRGENLNIELTGSEIEQAITFDFIKPLPRLQGQAFGDLEFANETTEAYDSRTLSLSSGLSKEWLDNRLASSASLALETSKVTTNDDEERNYFVSAPLSVLWSSEDDALDPTKGVRANLKVTPYTGTDTFVQTSVSARSRIQFGPNSRFTLAGRALLGGTLGVPSSSLPANKRYFAGGGGSVRGYAYQEAGPLDDDNDPIGGRSLIEAAAEARVKISQNIQLAAFVDTGSVSASALPDFNEEFFVGYGGGVRYMTPIGPIRADIAFPLEQRDTDRNFQIYIALGQAF